MTATSLLFVATRWIMVANALLMLAPVTEATSDFTLYHACRTLMSFAATVPH